MADESNVRVLAAQGKEIVRQVPKASEVTVLAPVTAQSLLHKLSDMEALAEKRMKGDGPCPACGIDPQVTNRVIEVLAPVRIACIKEMARIAQVKAEADPLEAIPRWNLVRDMIMLALKPFPKAREAVEEAIAHAQRDLR